MFNVLTRAAEPVTSIRPLTANDMAAVLEIEADAYLFPWLAKDFRDALLMDNVVGAVAERDGKVVGFMIFESHRNGVDLFELAVARNCWGTSVGRALVADLIATLDDQCRREIT